MVIDTNACSKVILILFYVRYAQHQKVILILFYARYAQHQDAAANTARSRRLG
jgi:hypothetical protein